MDATRIEVIESSLLCKKGKEISGSLATTEGEWYPIVIGVYKEPDTEEPTIDITYFKVWLRDPREIGEGTNYNVEAIFDSRQANIVAYLQHFHYEDNEYLSRMLNNSDEYFVCWGLDYDIQNYPGFPEDAVQ